MSRYRPRVPTLLAAAAMGSYLLVVLGATAAIADAATACPRWPFCTGSPLDDPALAVAWTHRIAAAVVGILVAVAAVAGWREGSTRVRASLGLGTGLYPAQVGIGAMIALGGPAWLSTAHLIVGMGIFAALVLALAWTLDPETSDATPAEPVPTVRSGRPTVSDGTSGSTAGSARFPRVRAYVDLMKPRLMWLLCLVAAAGMALAAGPTLGVRTVVATLGGGVLAIGASGTFNHVIERDRDRRMRRTADRPLATEQVGVRNAVVFGTVLAVASTAVFLTINALAAALGLAAILFYSVIYTVVLKPNTVQNTVLGGAAGALPALIGWAAVTGRIGLPALALAGVIFLWTPAHFYNLALAYKEDYERGGFPMLPVVRGEAVARRHVLLYLGATFLGSGALAAVTEVGLLYAGTTVAVGGVFLWAVVRLHRERTRGAALRAFHASNAYLGAVLVAIVVDALAI